MRLTIGSGPKTGKVISVQSTPMTVGRDEACELVLDDPEVSRKHACLEPLPDGRVTIRDLGSRNGTYVNGRQVQAGLLKGGEEVRIGQTVLISFLEPTVVGTPVPDPPRPPDIEPGG
jgi:pSer/pThr/pTyr-binding forkhead associated (FHA) protein